MNCFQIFVLDYDIEHFDTRFISKSTFSFIFSLLALEQKNNVICNDVAYCLRMQSIKKKRDNVILNESRIINLMKYKIIRMKSMLEEENSFVHCIAYVNFEGIFYNLLFFLFLNTKMPY